MKITLTSSTLGIVRPFTATQTETDIKRLCLSDNNILILFRHE